MTDVSATNQLSLDVKGTEKLKDLYEDFMRIPTVTGARLHKGNEEGIVELTSTWSSACLPMKMPALHQRHTLLKETEEDDGKFEAITTNVLPMSNMDTQMIAYSQSGSKIAQIFTVEEKGEKKFHLKVSDADQEILCVELTGQNKHGIIHGLGSVDRPSPFGVFRFSHGEGHILYCADRKGKCSEYYDADLEWESEEKIVESKVGSKYEVVDHWGESMFEIKRPVLCICDVSSGSVTVLDEVPAGISPTYAVWTPKDTGVVFFGLEEQPFKLGRVACNNRKGHVYHYDLSSASITKLSDDGIGVEHIVFSPKEDRLVWFERVVDAPHNCCFSAVKLSWPHSPGARPVKLVSIEEDPDWIEDTFPGLYNVSVPARCWSADGKRLLISSVWRSKYEILSLDISSGSVIKLTNTDYVRGNWMLLDVLDHVLVASVASPNRPPVLAIALLPQAGEEDKIVWKELERRPKSLSHLTQIHWELATFERPGVSPYEGVLIMPTSGTDLPLVLFPHGGPHGISLASWLRGDIGLLLNAGFAVLAVNYHGSLGFGDKFVRSLPGRCGELDVEDCHFAVQNILTKHPRLSANKLFAFGGSHGGFLVSHLAGQYPGVYKAVCASNPVLNMDTMHHLTDMTEWCVVEGAGVMPDFASQPTKQQREKMYDSCPIAHVDKIICPYLLLIGESDLRVPPHYRAFIRNLQARGVECKVLSYPKTGHQIGNTEYAADWAINMVRWFQKRL